MYLEGQLPLGPDSSNRGAPPIPALADPSGSTFYTIPDGGPVVVSPTLANADGVVQMPLTDPKNPGYQVQSGYGSCASYAADGSLTPIRHNAYRNGLEGLCRSGEQLYQGYKIEQPSAPWGLLLAIGAGVLLIGGGK